MEFWGFELVINFTMLEVLQLGTFSGKLTKPKGMGSFGAVWGAKALTGSTPGNAVIKDAQIIGN
eukprot:827409-Amphidinium_carterae.1